MSHDSNQRSAVVRLGPPDQVFVCLCPEGEFLKGTDVVVHTKSGDYLGTVVKSAEEQTPPADAPTILRAANDEDQTKHKNQLDRAAFAVTSCRESAHKLDIPLRPLHATIDLDGRHVRIEFLADGRVDFRQLLRDLGHLLQSRVELKQVGVRDATRHAAGVGVCGRSLCCSTWMPGFEPISIRHAKTQNLSLNQFKLSGLCGRLRCCLQYEQETYETLKKDLPKIGKRVRTPEGEGRVRDAKILKRIVRVALNDGRYEQFPADKVERLFPPEQQGKNDNSSSSES